MKSISALPTFLNFCRKSIDPSVTLALKTHLSECREFVDARIKNDMLHYANSSTQKMNFTGYSVPQEIKELAGYDIFPCGFSSCITVL